MTYEEAKSWFWTRTWLWSVPAAGISMVAWFFVPSTLFVETEHVAQPARMWIAVGAGVVSVLVGLLSAKITTQLPWMRSGWRFAFIFNAPSGTVISGIIAFLLGAAAISAMETAIPSAQVDVPMKAVERVLQEVVAPGRALVWFGTGACVLWGFVFSSWFAIRRDKYFVDRL
jgi:hypothetical protein